MLYCLVHNDYRTHRKEGILHNASSSSRFRRDARELDQDEEAWFNNEEEQLSPVTTTATSSPKFFAAPLTSSTSPTPSLPSHPSPFTHVSYSPRPNKPPPGHASASKSTSTVSRCGQLDIIVTNNCDDLCLLFVACTHCSHTCSLSHIHTHTYIHTHTHAHTCSLSHIHTHTYIHTHIHTHTCSHTRALTHTHQAVMRSQALLILADYDEDSDEENEQDVTSPAKRQKLNDS